MPRPPDPLRRRLLAAPLAWVGLSACSPQHDWREIRTAHWAAMFPAKPATGTRALPFGDTRIELTLHTCEIEGVTFAVGSAALPAPLAGTPAQRASTVEAFETALLRNLSAKPVSRTTAPVTAWTRAQLPPPDAAREVVADGRRAESSQRVTARFWATPNRMFEVVVAGPPYVFPSEPVDTFLSGFRPL